MVTPCLLCEQCPDARKPQRPQKLNVAAAGGLLQPAHPEELPNSQGPHLPDTELGPSMDPEPRWTRLAPSCEVPARPDVVNGLPADGLSADGQ